MSLRAPTVAVMVVVPAASQVDLSRLKSVTGATNAVLATEQVQVRDVALAVCLKVTDQKPDEYGFEEREIGSSGFRYYNPLGAYMPPEKREAAIEKWKAWREKHPDFEKDKEKR